MSGADHGSFEDRFWRRVPKYPDAFCWPWKGKPNKQTGYGGISDQRGKRIGAHRASYIIHYGDIPVGLVVRHKCDNRICVNPLHLELGTQADNVADMWDRGRAVAPPRNTKPREPAEVRRKKNALRMGRKKTHCKRNHPLPPHQSGKTRRCMEPECREARRYNALGGDYVHHA